VAMMTGQRIAGQKFYESVCILSLVLNLCESFFFFNMIQKNNSVVFCRVVSLVRGFLSSTSSTHLCLYH
jgi:hypothetical protein